VIARMWEARITEGQLNDFCAWAASEAWPQFAAAQGFSGGEVYRSNEQGLAVIVTRWADSEALAAGNTWFDLGAERFCADEPHVWEFDPVPVG